MSSLWVVTLALVGTWLGVLTLVIILLVRQIGLLTLRLQTTEPVFSFAQDGPDIGSEVPADVLAVLPDLGYEITYIVILSATCGPCREFASDLTTSALKGRTVAVLAGRVELADGFEALLPPGVAVVRDPEAAVAANLHVESTPFALEIDHGMVTGKAYLRQVSDLAALIDARATSDAGKLRPQEVAGDAR